MHCRGRPAAFAFATAANSVSALLSPSCLRSARRMDSPVASTSRLRPCGAGPEPCLPSRDVVSGPERPHRARTASLSSSCPSERPRTRRRRPAGGLARDLSLAGTEPLELRTTSLSLCTCSGSTRSSKVPPTAVRTAQTSAGSSDAGASPASSLAAWRKRQRRAGRSSSAGSRAGLAWAAAVALSASVPSARAQSPVIPYLCVTA